jgi:benzodiazapine receptor
MLVVALGAASLIVLKETDYAITPAIKSYAIQLGLKFAWAALYFHKRWFGVALIELGAVFVSSVVTAILFYDIDKTAGLLVVPTIVMHATAFTLNFYVWWNNPAQTNLDE